MDGFFSALSASLVLLMLMSVGYFMGRLGWMTAAEKRFLSKFIVNIAVPCNCVTGLLNNLDHDSLLQAGQTIKHIQDTTGRYVGCLEELGLYEGWISDEQVHDIGKELDMTLYGKYLQCL